MSFGITIASADHLRSIMRGMESALPHAPTGTLYKLVRTSPGGHLRQIEVSTAAVTGAPLWTLDGNLRQANDVVRVLLGAKS